MPSGGHDSSQPTRSCRAPVKAPFRWPEQLGFDEGRRQRRQVEGVKRPLEIRRERFPLRVERDVAGEPNRAGHQLLAGPGRSGHERRDVVHPTVERAPVAAHVVREDRLPHVPPQLRGGPGRADDVAEDEVERAADLEEAGEQVRRVHVPRPADAVEVQVVPYVPAEPRVACQPAAAAPRVDVDLVQIVLVAPVQHLGHDVGIQRELFGGSGPRPEQALPGVPRDALGDCRQLLQGRIPPVACLEAPDRAARNLVRAENRAFDLDELGVERIAAGQPRQQLRASTRLPRE